MSKLDVNKDTVALHVSEVLKKQEQTATELSAVLQKKRNDIKKLSTPSLLRVNTLLAHSIAAAIEKGKDLRYGQILRNIGIILELRDEKAEKPVLWKNDNETDSYEFLERLGGLDAVTNNLRAYFKKHSGLLKTENQEPKTELTRYDYNKMINQFLMATVQRYPNWHFGNILRQLEITKEALGQKIYKEKAWCNEFNTESKAIYTRVVSYKEILKKLGAKV